MKHVLFALLLVLTSQVFADATLPVTPIKIRPADVVGVYKNDSGAITITSQDGFLKIQLSTPNHGSRTYTVRAGKQTFAGRLNQSYVVAMLAVTERQEVTPLVLYFNDEMSELDMRFSLLAGINVSDLILSEDGAMDSMSFSFGGPEARYSLGIMKRQ